jgi:hypothetical protein
MAKKKPKTIRRPRIDYMPIFEDVIDDLVPACDDDVASLARVIAATKDDGPLCTSTDPLDRDDPHCQIDLRPSSKPQIR